MDDFGGGAKGYWKNSYYRRLANDDKAADQSGSTNLAARRRRKPPSSRRRKLARPPPVPPLQASSSSTTSWSSPPPFALASATSDVVPATKPVPHRRHRRRRFWRMRVTLRLAFLQRIASFPLRLLRRLQRGYVHLMLKFAGAMGGAAMPDMAGYSLPRPVLKEYDERMLVEIYRALVAQGQVHVVPTSGAGPNDGDVPAARLVAR